MRRSVIVVVVGAALFLLLGGQKIFNRSRVASADDIVIDFDHSKLSGVTVGDTVPLALVIENRSPQEIRLVGLSVC